MKSPKPKPGDLVPSLKAAAAKLHLDVLVLKDAKSRGCGAFRPNGNVVLSELLKWLDEDRAKFAAKRKQSRDAEYRKWVERAMGKVIRCERCHFGRGFARLEPHHPFGRQGENLFKVTPLCSICHAWCHETPNTAYVAGWLQPEYRGVQRQPGHPQPFTLLPYP